MPSPLGIGGGSRDGKGVSEEITGCHGAHPPVCPLSWLCMPSLVLHPSLTACCLSLSLSSLSLCLSVRLAVSHACVRLFSLCHSSWLCHSLFPQLVRSLLKFRDSWRTVAPLCRGSRHSVDTHALHIHNAHCALKAGQMPSVKEEVDQMTLETPTLKYCMMFQSRLKFLHCLNM